ncbi:unnamed protein product [Aphis gossypii]|uniref:Uncharacterized protein n=2 Tax=Aphis gossypii TaxID=80765 RepID=A0A9P0NQU9_APHGO|nr:unnamed protein product [Aphis gossypii]
MGNTIMRQTVFRKSWWTNGCGGDIVPALSSTVEVQTDPPPLEERREHRAFVKELNSSGGGDGLGSVEDYELDNAAGHQLVGSFLTKWYNEPHDVWRFYVENAICTLDMDGKRYVATGISEIRKLFDEVAAPETGTIEDDDGDCRSLFVQSIVTVRCPSGQLLIVASTERFTQTFIVEYTTPDPAVAGVASMAVVTSVMTVKRVGVYPQDMPRTPSIRRRRRRRGRRGKNAESQGANADATVASTATGGVETTGGVI